VGVELTAVRIDQLGEGLTVGVPNRFRHAKSFAVVGVKSQDVV
jgi:hypothetical protein